MPEPRDPLLKVVFGCVRPLSGVFSREVCLWEMQFLQRGPPARGGSGGGVLRPARARRGNGEVEVHKGLGMGFCLAAFSR